MSVEAEKRVGGYPDPPQTRERLEMETYEYHMPFNYSNITVNLRHLRGKEFHGIELNPINSIGADSEHHPPDNITIEEEDPIVKVVVIGSACTPPGWVQCEAFPTEEFYKPVDVPGGAAVRYRINNLWGTHLRCDTWLVEANGEFKEHRGRTYEDVPDARYALWQGVPVEEVDPKSKNWRIKSHYRENPLVGMSCSIFEIPKSKKVIITGGSEICAWSDDNYPDDLHYSFRTIRTTLAVGK